MPYGNEAYIREKGGFSGGEAIISAIVAQLLSIAAELLRKRLLANTTTVDLE